MFKSTTTDLDTQPTTTQQRLTCTLKNARTLPDSRCCLKNTGNNIFFFRINWRLVNHEFNVAPQEEVYLVWGPVIWEAVLLARPVQSSHRCKRPLDVDTKEEFFRALYLLLVLSPAGARVSPRPWHVPNFPSKRRSRSPIRVDCLTLKKKALYTFETSVNI